MPAKIEAVETIEPDRIYPHLERFLEDTERDDAAGLFDDTKEQLAALGAGAKSRQAKKALAALEQVETLLGQLFDVKDRLAEQAKSAKKSRR